MKGNMKPFQILKNFLLSSNLSFQPSPNKSWLIGKGVMVVDNQNGVAREIVCQHLKE